MLLLDVPATARGHHWRTLLLRYMARPQRHRLLHGFPLAAAMPYASQEVRRRAAEGDTDFCLTPDPTRQFLVGVLPHSSCNPKVPGCGFCTFPHETYNAVKSAAVVAGVIQEISGRLAAQPELAQTSIAGLYIGGGTANLTPPEPFRRLARTLGEAFDVSQAEVTLEGVPAYFVRRKPQLVDILQEELPARHFRISMGLQTFSESRLRQMGRLAFGRPATFAEAVKLAHDRGMTVSGDLLFNLPGQHLAEMREDVERAIAIGLDQVCLYHLVMFRGLGTPWSRDEQLLAALPNNHQAAENWVVLRELLLSRGFRQTSLTNFERRELERDPRRYQYETMSFEPDRHQMLGFGPAGVSYTAAANRRYALKTMNPESSAEYLQAVHSGRAVWNRYYQYHLVDLKLFHLTRRLAALRIEEDRYRQAFGSDVWDDFADQLTLLLDEGLIDKRDHAITPTSRGMFYADTIAALLAEEHLRSRRETELGGSDERHRRVRTWAIGDVPYNDNGHGHM
jgi:oxygen-independent coproporphyrinogen-3 oxidase